MFVAQITCRLGITLCVASSLVAQDKSTTSPITPVAVGQEMFRADRASCHGLDGKSGGPTASALENKPTDLTQLSKRNGGKFPSAMVEQAIQANSLIPAHGSRGCLSGGTHSAA